MWGWPPRRRWFILGGERMPTPRLCSALPFSVRKIREFDNRVLRHRITRERMDGAECQAVDRVDRSLHLVPHRVNECHQRDVIRAAVAVLGSLGIVLLPGLVIIFLLIRRE